MSTRDTDLGWGKFMDNMVTVDNSYTKVGLPDNEPIKPGTKKGSGSDGAESMSELVKIASIHEFGNWPFMRSAFDQNRSKINKVQEVIYGRLVSGRVTVKKGLGLIGSAVTRLVQKRLTDIRTPPNAPETIKKKKSSNPLIDTGQLRQSITHVEVIRGV